MSSNLKVNTILPSVGSNIGLGTNGGNLNVDGGCKVQVGTALTLGHTVGVQFATQNLHSAGFEVNNVNASGIITATSFVGSLSGGSVSGTSGAFTGNIDLNSDTNKLKIGAGDDFQFFHNGSNNFIETNNGDIRIKTSDSSGNLTFTTGGSTERLRIHSGGQVQIAGDSIASISHFADDLVIGESGSSAISGLTLCSTDSSGIRFHDTADMGEIEFDHSDNSLAIKANQILKFRTNSGERLRINQFGQVGINTTVGGRVAIAVDSNSTNPLATGFIALILKNTNTTDNTSVCMDFNNSVGGIVGRFGAQFKDTSDKDTDLYFATREDGGSLAERMRIASDGHVSLRNTDSSHQEIQWYRNTNKYASIGWGDGSANWEFKHFRADNQANNPYANIDFFTGSTTSPTRALRITEDGNHIREKHSRFATRIAYNSGNEAASVKIPFQSAHVNVGGDFSDSNDRFTAPVDGDYAFWFFTNVAKSGSGAYFATWYKNGSEANGSHGGRMYDQHSGSGWNNLSGCIMLNLSEGDYVEVYNGSQVVNYDGNSYGQWMGWLVG